MKPRFTPEQAKEIIDGSPLMYRERLARQLMPEMKPCRLCDGLIDMDDSLYSREIGICSECAESAANLFWKQHSGEYLTWPNPPRPARLKKKKKIGARLQLKVWKRDGFKCLKCGETENLTADHVIPESKGGPTTFENLQTLCGPCNLRKGTKMP